MHKRAKSLTSKVEKLQIKQKRNTNIKEIHIRKGANSYKTKVVLMRNKH